MILPTQLVHIRISKELLHQVDTAADSLYLSRNEYIRQAVAEKLRTTARHSLLWLHTQNLGLGLHHAHAGAASGSSWLSARHVNH